MEQPIQIEAIWAVVAFLAVPLVNNSIVLLHDWNQHRVDVHFCFLVSDLLKNYAHIKKQGLTSQNVTHCIVRGSYRWISCAFSFPSIICLLLGSSNLLLLKIKTKNLATSLAPPPFPKLLNVFSITISLAVPLCLPPLTTLPSMIDLLLPSALHYQLVMAFCRREATNMFSEITHRLLSAQLSWLPMQKKHVKNYWQVCSTVWNTTIFGQSCLSG